MNCPFAFFGLTPSATKEVLTKRYRELCQKAHPDKGGTNDQFIELKKAYATALSRVGYRAPLGACTACKGLGAIYITTGVTTLKIRCPSCLGGKT